MPVKVCDWRWPMSRQPNALASPEQAKGDERAAVARAYLLDVDVDRPKWIDQYLDYFGSGEESRPSPADREREH